MDIQEQLRSSINRLSPSVANDKQSSDDNQKWFVEEVTHMHSRDVDYWLGKYGSDRRVWIGSEERMTIHQARQRARDMVRRISNSEY